PSHTGGAARTSIRTAGGEIPLGGEIGTGPCCSGPWGFLASALAETASSAAAITQRVWRSVMDPLLEAMEAEKGRVRLGGAPLERGIALQCEQRAAAHRRAGLAGMEDDQRAGARAAGRNDD